MDVSNCPDCKRALKKALLKGDDPTKLKMKDGHLVGCPSLTPKPEPRKEGAADVYPWSEAAYKIAPAQRAPVSPAGPQHPAQGGAAGGRLPGDSATPHVAPPGQHWGTPPRPPQPTGRRQRSDRRHEPGGRAGVPDRGHAQAEHVHQFKFVTDANRGERIDRRKGVWFVILVLGVVLTLPFPPVPLLFLGAIAMLFFIR